jgi:hypothetical protein
MNVLTRSTPRLVRAALYVLFASLAIQVAHGFIGLAEGGLMTPACGSTASSPRSAWPP